MEKEKDGLVYPYSATYAREHGELEQYRASYRANVDCRNALEDAIKENYRDNRLNSAAVLRQVRENYSDDRIRHVLVVTVKEKDWDGRIDDRNKEWAKAMPIPEDKDGFGFDRRCTYAINQAHPGLVDLLVSAYRKEETQLRKPSILEKIQKAPQSEPAALKPDKAVRREDAR